MCSELVQRALDCRHGERLAAGPALPVHLEGDYFGVLLARSAIVARILVVVYSPLMTKKQ